MQQPRIVQKLSFMDGEAMRQLLEQPQYGPKNYNTWAERHLTENAGLTVWAAWELPSPIGGWHYWPMSSSEELLFLTESALNNGCALLMFLISDTPNGPRESWDIRNQPAELLYKLFHEAV